MYLRVSWFSVKWKIGAWPLANRSNDGFGFSVLASEFKFAIALGEDLEVAAGEPIGRGNVADGRVEPHGVVMVNEALDKSSAILLGKRAAWPETIDFEAQVPAFHWVSPLSI